MKLPYLRMWDNTPVTVSITQGTSEEGQPLVVSTYVGKCNYSEKTKYAQSSGGIWIRLAGTLTIGQDIVPEVPVLEGYVTLGSLTCKIYGGTRPRNPDGTVNHTRLELI